MFNLNIGVKKMNKQIKKLIKVLAKAAVRHGASDRLQKVKEMDRGLTAMGLICLRQQRDGRFPLFNKETLDAADKLIQTTITARSRSIILG